MPFIQRNTDGKIVARFEQRQSPDQEWVPVTEPGLPNIPTFTPTYNLGAFRVGMMNDSGYQRIAAIAQPHHLTAVVGAIVVTPLFWPAVTATWNQMIAGLDPANAPTAEEIAQWNAIGQATSVLAAFQCSFNEQGYLVGN